MPNWCSNQIAFYQEDGGCTLLEAFHADIQKYVGYREPDTGRFSNWAGHWLESNKINPDSVSCRGSFESCELYFDHVIISMETAWGPIPELWEKLAEKYDLRYVYIAEECGGELYINTDSCGRFFTTRYILNYFDLDYLEIDSGLMSEYRERLKELSEETRYYDDFEEVLDDFKDFGFRVTNLEELNKCLEKFNLEVYEYSSGEE